MPVQINEVIIRTVVDNTAPGTASNPSVTKPDSQQVPATEIAALVLEIIKEKNER